MIAKLRVGCTVAGCAPGVRTMVTNTDQKALESRQLTPNHKSAYDYDSFTKADRDH